MRNFIKQNLKLLKLKGRLSFLGKAQNTIVSAAFVISVSSGLSAFLGLFKGRLLTSYFGVSNELGVFYTADKIPNLVYSLLVVGVLTTIFIPVFTDLINKDEDKAWETASSIISIGIISFLSLGIVTIIFAPQIINLIALGRFSENEIVLGAELMRIMIFAQLILVISSFITSILQSFRMFLIPALAPILYNLGMIAGIIIFSTRFGIYGPAIGVILGALLHLFIQVPLLKRTNIKFKFGIAKSNDEVGKAYWLVPARLLNVTYNNLIPTISNSLAILISTASVVILKFASQLQFFPVSLFGASMAVAALPVLSKHSGHKEMDKFKKILITTLHQMWFLVMPASVILIVLRIPIVRIVYGVSNFTWEDTVFTAYTLAFFSISIFSQSAVYLLTRSFYAKKDTKTPAKASTISILTFISIALLFVNGFSLGVWSIAFAFSITSIVEMILLFYLLSKRLGDFDFAKITVPFIKISYASLFMGLSLYLPLKLLDEFVFDTTRTMSLIVLTGIATFAGVVSYLFFTYMFKVEEIQLLYKLMGRLNIKFPKETVPAEVVPEH